MTENLKIEISEEDLKKVFQRIPELNSKEGVLYFADKPN